MTANPEHWWLIAEYCQGPFYMGWHLYLRQRRNGSCNDDGEWGWIRRSHSLTHEISRLLDGMDESPPLIKYTQNTWDEIRQWDAFVNWFAEHHKGGLTVTIDQYPYPRSLTLIPQEGERNDSQASTRTEA